MVPGVIAVRLGCAGPVSQPSPGLHEVEPVSLTDMSWVPAESSRASTALIGVLLRQGSPSKLKKTRSPAIEVNENTSVSDEGAGPASEPSKKLLAAELAVAVVLFGSLSSVAEVVTEGHAATGFAPGGCKAK